MKKIILSSLFCFVSFTLCAQPVWHAEIPCDSYCSAFQKRGLIKTLDDNYLVGLNESTQYQSRIYLVKYDQEGNLTWKKPYDFGATTPSPPYTAGPFLSRFIEDANGDILCVGTIIDGSKIPPHQSFFFRTDSEGDSLHLNIDSTYSGYSNLFLLNEEGEYFALRGNGYSRLGYSGEIIDEVTIEGIAGSNAGILIHEDHIYTAILGDNPYFIDSSRYKKYDLYTGELVLQKKYADIGDLLLLDDDENIVAYSSGLMKMDLDFNPIWSRPFEDYYDLGYSGLVQTGQAISKTQDGGFILGGDIEIGLVHGVFLIKTDEEGFVEWNAAYNDLFFGIRYLHGLVQAEDGGYVFLGYDDSGNTTLVKTNANGLFTDTSEPDSGSIGIQAFPNPCRDHLYLSSSQPLNGTIRIFNAYGQLIRQMETEGFSQTVNTQSLSSGIYFLEYEGQVIKFICL